MNTKTTTNTSDTATVEDVILLSFAHALDEAKPETQEEALTLAKAYNADFLGGGRTH